MKTERLARILKKLVTITFLCNLLALPLVAGLARLRGEPFTRDNAANLRRAAVCCFLISGAALLRTVWGLFYYRGPGPLFTYNALFVPVFFMAGLLCLVMSALFRQAAELKEENDLTI